MTKFNSLSLVGFSGKILTDVIIGGELLLGPTSFCFSQDKFTPKMIMRKKNKVMLLINRLNSGFLNLSNKGIEMFFFFMNILWKTVDFFCNHSFINIIPHALNIDPRFNPHFIYIN